MRIAERQEFRFLEWSQKIFRGEFFEAADRPLDAQGKGLHRLDGDLPTGLALRHDLPRTVLRWLVEQGAARPRRYVIRERRRIGSLVSPEVFPAWGPLEFSPDCFGLLEALYGQPLDEVRGPVARLGSLSDQLFLVRVLETLPLRSFLWQSPEASGPGDGVRGLFERSALARIFFGSFRAPEEDASPLDRPGMRVVLTGIEDGLVRSWIARTRRILALSSQEAGTELENLSRHLQDYLGFGRKKGWERLLVAVLEFYGRLFLDCRSPEAWIQWGSERSKVYRRVADKEVWLAKLGELFTPAGGLLGILAEIKSQSNFERSEGERILFDQSRRQAPEVLEQAQALGRAFQGQVA